MNVKFGWVTKHDQSLYQTLIGSSAVLGLTLGAVSGGKIVTIGRRKSYIMACAVGLFGVVLTLFESIAAILIGRLIFGLSCGLLSINIPRYIEETIPSD
jgi:MFS family permease